ncbi:MAG: hypothetical protein DMF63_09445 [Acidobacteria bacterium]|nr:MAG: hypothetical protein DMF63_09445 [Acidobacteriota bacterium]
MSAPDGKRNLEEGLSMIPLSNTFNHAGKPKGLQKFLTGYEKGVVDVSHTIYNAFPSSNRPERVRQHGFPLNFDAEHNCRDVFPGLGGSDATLAASRGALQREKI